MRWEDLKGTENTRPVIDRNFVVATVAPPTKQTEVAGRTDWLRRRGAVAAAAPAAAPARGAPARGGAGGGRGGGSRG